MMKWIFGGMILLSVLFGLGTGRIAAVSLSALDDGTKAIELFLYMVGGMCVWGGVMRVAREAGVTSFLCRLFRPVGRFLFPGLDMKGRAFQAISMNVAANLLGLGNAATPLGLEAMRELAAEESGGTKGDGKLETGTASGNMITFVVLNTASITLIPTTVATLRLRHGAAQPLDVMPAILLTSLLSVTAAVLLAHCLNCRMNRLNRQNSRRHQSESSNFRIKRFPAAVSPAEKIKTVSGSRGAGSHPGKKEGV